MKLLLFVLLSLLNIILALRRTTPNRGLGTPKSASAADAESGGVRASVKDLERYCVLCKDEDKVAKLDKGMNKHSNIADIRVGSTVALGSVIGMLCCMLGVSITLTSSSGHCYIISGYSTHPQGLGMIVLMAYCSYLRVFIFQFLGTFCSSVMLVGDTPTRDNGPCSAGRSQIYLLQSRALERIHDATFYENRIKP